MMPSPAARARSLHAPFADFCGKQRPEPVPPKPHRLVADDDAPFMEQVFDVSQREGEPDVHHHREADDLGAGLEVPEWRALAHDRRLRRGFRRLKPSCLARAAPSLTVQPRLRRLQSVLPYFYSGSQEGYQRASRLAPTAPRTASPAIAIVYQVATKSGESFVHWAA